MKEPEGYSTDTEKFTACRHLLSRDSHAHHTTFPRLVSEVLKKYPDAEVKSRNALTFDEGKCSCRVDCGPCLIPERRESEIRVVVQAKSSEDNCGEVADAVAASLRSYDPSNEWHIKVCCRWCHNYYLELDDLKRARNERKPCGNCNEILRELEDLRHGYKDKESHRQGFTWDIHAGKGRRSPPDKI